MFPEYDRIHQAIHVRITHLPIEDPIRDLRQVRTPRAPLSRAAAPGLSPLPLALPSDRPAPLRPRARSTWAASSRSRA